LRKALENNSLFSPMSNSRNRSLTFGAFGKPKARVVGRPPFKRKPVASAPQAPTGGFNISDALITFAEPVIKQAGNNHTALRGAMNVAILIWNALIEGGPALDEAQKKLLSLPGASSEQIEELVATMSERKAELYPDVKQLIRNYDLTFTKHGTRIYVSAINIAPPGVEKTNLAASLAQ
jgi:hypothetical protein